MISAFAVFANLELPAVDWSCLLHHPAQRSWFSRLRTYRVNCIEWFEWIKHWKGQKPWAFSISPPRVHKSHLCPRDAALHPYFLSLHLLSPHPANELKELCSNKAYILHHRKRCTLQVLPDFILFKLQVTIHISLLGLSNKAPQNGGWRTETWEDQGPMFLLGPLSWH